MFKQHRLAHRAKAAIDLNTKEGETWLPRKSQSFRTRRMNPTF